LPRSGLVNRAFAINAIKKDTIAIGVFHQAFARPDLPNVLLLEIRDGHLDLRGQRLDF
jgi:hypothetical protein